MIIDLDLILLPTTSLVFFLIVRMLDKFLIDIGVEPTIWAKEIFKRRQK